MIPVLFPGSRERMKALGVWAGIAALGGTFGTVISGALTDLAWRWIFYINIPVVLFALLMVPRVLPESRMAREGHRIDVPGVVTATGGLVAVCTACCRPPRTRGAPGRCCCRWPAGQACWRSWSRWRPAPPSR
jgi:MFS family permease